MRPDVIVVGAGLAGLSAAARLGEAGAKVLVLAKGVGATHLSAGTIDVLGYADATTGRRRAVRRPLEALGELPDEHPYHLVGAQGVAEAIAWFKGCIAAGPLAPYAYVGDGEENLVLPTAVGATKPSAAVPETMAAGDVRAGMAAGDAGGRDVRGGGKVCVVGFGALKDLHPALLADNLTRTVPGVRARSAELDVRPEGRDEHNSLGLARAFDDPAFRAQVVALLAGRLGAEERVGFPAVLGVADPHGVWSELEQRLGRPVFEIPTLPPSVPGMRVFTSLRDALARAGGRVIMNAVVTGAERAGDRVEALRVRVGLREVTHRADWVVLATGGFASGGLELDSRWRVRETALGLPVVGVPGAGEERFKPGYFDAHPMAQGGVAVDAELRPVADGERVVENVLVAGATLAGAVPWKEKSGDGLSLATGFRAAELVAGAGSFGRAGAPAGAEA